MLYTGNYLVPLDKDYQNICAESSDSVRQIFGLHARKCKGKAIPVQAVEALRVVRG
jgi:hypothetical protein